MLQAHHIADLLEEFFSVAGRGDYFYNGVHEFGFYYYLPPKARLD